MNCEEEIKTMEIPTNGVFVIKSDEVDHHQMEAIKKGLEEKHGFKGSIFCIPIDNDMYILSQTEVCEVFKELIDKVDALELKIKDLTKKTEDWKVDIG